MFHFVLTAVKQLKETVSSSIHKLANFDGKCLGKVLKGIPFCGQTLMLVCLDVSVEVMDAHLQNNQMAEDILDSPDQLKSNAQMTCGIS